MRENVVNRTSMTSKLTKGAFLVRDNRVLNGPLGRLLRSFARTAHSAHSLSIAPLCYALFTGSLTHFAHSLVGWLKFLNMCSYCKRVSRDQSRFSSSLGTRPQFLSSRLHICESKWELLLSGRKCFIIFAILEVVFSLSQIFFVSRLIS